MLDIAGGILLAIAILWLIASVVGFVGMGVGGVFEAIVSGIRATNQRMKHPSTGPR